MVVCEYVWCVNMNEYVQICMNMYEYENASSSMNMNTFYSKRTHSAVSDVHTNPTPSHTSTCRGRNLSRQWHIL